MKAYQTNTKFFLYFGRHGERILMPATRDSWDYLRAQQDEDNNMSAEQILEEMGPDAFYGDPEYGRGFFSIDEGGEITTIELTVTPTDNDYADGHTYDRT